MTTRCQVVIIVKNVGGLLVCCAFYTRRTLPEEGVSASLPLTFVTPGHYENVNKQVLETMLNPTIISYKKRENVFDFTHLQVVKVVCGRYNDI